MKIVVFDAFGTLFQIGERKFPYRQLMLWLRENGRAALPDDAARIMSLDVSLAELANEFSTAIPVEFVSKWEAGLRQELDSIRLFPDSLEAIQAVQAAGLSVGLCSNLAAPYGSIVRALLPALDVYALSYEVGAVKPDPKVYRSIISMAQCRPEDVLFIGDSAEADLHGPKRFGMNAILLDRGRNGLLSTVVAALATIPACSERHGQRVLQAGTGAS